MSVAVTLPEEVAVLAKSQGEDLDRAVAEVVVFYHYEHGRISAGKAAQLLRVGRSEFERMRADRGIDRPFTAEELASDIEWARNRHG